MLTPDQAIMHATSLMWIRCVRGQLMRGIERKSFGTRLTICLSALILFASLTGCNFVKSLFLGPTITTNKVPNAVVGKPYDAKIEVSGALFADTWISAGAVPPGLTFQEGRISGVPTTGGSYGFQVSATDNSGDYPLNDDKRFTILVLDIAAQPLAQATANRTYGPVTLTTVGHVGAVAWTVTSGTLPDGIDLQGTGELLGNATDGGNFPFTVTAVDQDSPPRSKSQDLVLNVENPVPSISTLSPSSAGVGTASFALEVHGSDFVKSSRVLWDTSERPTTFVDTTMLNTAIPATDLAVLGSPVITVSNALPGGGISNTLPFEITPNASAALVRISVGTEGVQANGPSGQPAISANARFVAFESEATNLVASDHNLQSDIFVRDTCRNAGPPCLPSTIRASLADDGSEADGPSHRPSISVDGRYVVFTSQASNLVSGDTNSSSDIFLRDTCLGAPSDCRPSTALVSVAAAKSPSAGNSDKARLSSSGRYVVFASTADHLVADDTNYAEGIFLRDTCIGSVESCSPSTIRVSVDELERAFATPSTDPSPSSDGRFVAFATGSSNFQSHIFPDGTSQVYVRDTCLSAGPDCRPSTKAITVEDGNGIALSRGIKPSLSPDGRFVTFIASFARLSSADRTEMAEVVLRNTCKAADLRCHPLTSRLSAAVHGEAPNENSLGAVASASGRYVAFLSAASNLVPNDENHHADVFLRDTCSGIKSCIPATWRVSRGHGGLEADADSADLALTPDGKTLVFATTASTLIPDDTNGVADVYLYVNDNTR